MQLQISTRHLTGGYLSRTSGDPSIPVGESVSYLLNNLDVLRYIFFNFNLTAEDLGRCAMVCRRFRAVLKSKDQYHRFPFIVRYKVLQHWRFNTNAQHLVQRMQSFLDNPETDYSQFKIPENRGKMKSLVGRFLHITPSKTLDPLLEECQKRIEKFHICSFLFQLNEDGFAKVLVEDKNNEYEMQAWHDCLYPAVRKVMENIKNKRLPTGGANYFSLPVYLCVAEAVLRASKEHEMVLDQHVRQASCPDDLKALNKILPQAEYLEMLTISTSGQRWLQEDKRIGDFSWVAGNGINALKSGIVHAPRLRTLTFFEIEHLIDEKNALAIADMIITRQKLKKLKPFEEVRFGDNSITENAAWTLLEALKEYPVPIVIFISQAGNFASYQAPFGRDLRQLGRNVNFRWDMNYYHTNERMAMATFFDERSGNFARLYIKNGVDVAEAKRNNTH